MSNHQKSYRSFFSLTRLSKKVNKYTKKIKLIYIKLLKPVKLLKPNQTGLNRLKPLKPAQTAQTAQTGLYWTAFKPEPNWNRANRAQAVFFGTYPSLAIHKVYIHSFPIILFRFLIYTHWYLIILYSKAYVIINP